MASTKAVSKKDMGGLQIENLGAPVNPTDAASRDTVDLAKAFSVSRANHTGTQIAATVSDFDTAVRASRLDQMAAPTGPVAFGGQRLTGVADPSGAQDGATKAYVDAQLSGLTSGQVLKGTVRAVSTVNVNLAAPGATIDGVAAANGDVFLLAGQTTTTQNGPYVYNGSAVAMTRATNWDVVGEAVKGSYWIVREGTKADQFALLTNDTDITIGTTVPTFTYIGATAGGVNGYTATCPSTAAGATWTVTHNLASKFVIAQVARVASPFDIVDVAIRRTTSNTLEVLPDVALATGEFEIMVQKVA
jgi:hypothetical protein